MLLATLLQNKRAEILKLATKHGAKNVRVFGSLVRGEARPESDLDLLIELEPDRSILDRIGLKYDLEDLLGCKVDVVTEKGLHEVIRPSVLKQAVAL